MTRVKRGNVARKRRKKVLKITEGFRGSSSLFDPCIIFLLMKISFKHHLFLQKIWRLVISSNLDSSRRLSSCGLSDVLFGWACEFEQSAILKNMIWHKKQNQTECKSQNIYKKLNCFLFNVLFLFFQREMYLLSHLALFLFRHSQPIFCYGAPPIVRTKK